MPSSLEARIHETGMRLYSRLEGQSPSVFQKDFWMGKVMGWSMSDPEFKADLFCFVDVFPSLTDAADIAQATEKFRVGNLYINRGSTGALVGRHPFGGFKMSGVGSKTGGPDYMHQFMVPRSVVENTIRRSYTPDVDPGRA